ncbi:hypothetical protein [Variovorax sp. PBL-E5]|uniref:hypothetical protein n=1 Tax=Variovorax sp. PBL-E5 TaxID=434014 RepID=UPI001E2A492B|nr:hypothetical protein [Variovorax sp. PBL-E5]
MSDTANLMLFALLLFAGLNEKALRIAVVFIGIALTIVTVPRAGLILPTNISTHLSIDKTMSESVG